MRLRALRLIAFGPFTDRELVFDGEGVPKGAIVLVLGANEAGKSTALRAISGVLFGIPAQTRDAHLHHAPELRIGAVLQAPDGATVEIVRRKGNKNTLLDPRGEVVDESVLRRLCGATTEAAFLTLFGLNHESLRAGAQALLEGGGDVGESLFDAALGGGRGIHRVLKELDGEASQLFTPQAHTRTLNVAIKAYNQAHERIRDLAGDGKAYEVQRRALAEETAERDRLDQLLRTKRGELQHAQRARRLAPLAARREHLRKRLDALGDVALLAPTAAATRTSTLAQLESAQANLTRLGGEIAAAEAALAARAAPGWLDDPIAARIGELPDLLGAHRKARRDLPGLAGELAEAERAAAGIASRLLGSPRAGSADAGVAGVAPEGTPTAALPMPALAEQGRVRKLALEEAGIADRCARSVRAHAEIAERRAKQMELLSQLPVARDARPLGEVLRQAERLHDLPERAEALARERRILIAELGAGSAALGLGLRTGDELLGLAVPSAEAVERFAQRMAGQQARADRLRDDEDDLARRRREVERELGELERTGGVPSVQALAAARESRGEAWRTLRAAWEQPAESGPAQGWRAAAAAFENAQARADEAADRLFREAARVAHAAALGTRKAQIEAAQRELELRRAELTRTEESTRAEWAAAWAPVGVPARSPEETREWLRNLEGLRLSAKRLAQVQQDLASFEEKLARITEKLAAEIAATDHPPPAADAGLEAHVHRARAALAASEEQARRRQALEAELARLAEELERAARERDEERAAAAAWREAWRAALAPLALAADTTAAEAIAVLDALVSLGRKRDDAAGLRRRVESIDRDAALFRRAVQELVSAVAPDLAGRPEEEAAEALLARKRAGDEARRERARLDEQLGRLRAAHTEAQLVWTGARERLQALMAAAGVSSVADLESAEGRSDEARAVRTQLGDTEDQIIAAAEGLALEAALAEACAAPAEELAARVEALASEVEALETDVRTAHGKVVSIAKGLAELESASRSAAAADAATDAQAQAATVRGLAEQYVRLRLATAMLAREIERHREAHQGPVLARAEQLLARLTLGRYAGLRADFGDADQPVLRCLRADGTRVPIEGLSDGTRDQLYLALRLASLERRAAAAPALPLVLDDVLIHFDDERAAAALAVLADHARTGQVLLFTHHARVVELAERALTPESFHVIRLD